MDSERRHITGNLESQNPTVRLLVVRALSLIGHHAIKSLRALKTARKKEIDPRVIVELDNLIASLGK